MNRERAVGFLACAGLLALCGLHAAEGFDPDELPRQVIRLPDGSTYQTIQHKGSAWRVSSAKELEGKKLPDNPNVCFEAKFSDLKGDEIQLLGVKGRVVCEPEKIKQVKLMQRFDNVWICGRIDEVAGRKGLELRMEDIQRMGTDLQLAQKRLALYENNKDIQGLMDLAKRISDDLAQNIYDFNLTDEFLTLKSKAISAALNFREKALPPKDDAAGWFKLARDYKELASQPRKYAELIRSKVLFIDPDHPNASRIAVEELEMVKVPGVGWLTKDERDKLMAEQKKVREQQDTEKKIALESRAKQREEAIRDRPQLLSNYRSALRTSDPKALEGALRSLGEAVQSTPDPVFGQQGIEILANIQDPYAVLPGLELAAKSEWPEVRKTAYEAMAWRADEAGLRAVSAALAKERDVASAKAAVDALVQRGGKPAMRTLVESLANEESRVSAEFIEGLKVLAAVSHSDKESWRRWWEAQKDKP